MPFWRCPHCATPQAESARCWLCGRSTTSCAACRHYRRGVAGGLGLCGRDPRRLALHGTEVRPCWEPAPSGEPAPRPRADEAPAPVAVSRLRGSGDGVRQPRTFVPIEDVRRTGPGVLGAAVPEGLRAASGRHEPPPPRWSLWGDPDS